MKTNQLLTSSLMHLLLGLLASGALFATALSANATVVNFALGADDYGTLTIGGITVCTYDNISAAGGGNGSIDLQPGVWYNIVIDYKNRAGSDGMSLSWDQPVGPASIGYGFSGSFPNLVPKVNFRTLDATGTNFVSGLRGDYYDLSGNLQSSVFGEGPIDAINNVYNNQIVGSWNGYGYFSLFEERLSGQIRLAPPEQGIDISRSAGAVPLAVWQSILDDGNTFVVVDAWMGRSQNEFAQTQLTGGGTAGMDTAAYCLLNFDNSASGGPANQDGAWQVGQALAAIGAERAFISFMAIDVESAFPLKLKLNDRIQRITEAVNAATAVGLPVVIYTTRGNWKRITGNTTIFSTAGIPLWDARGDNVADLSLDRTKAWQPYGGWTRRQGKQYVLDTTLFGIRVDLDVFDPSLF